jgi:uncharacterized protein YegL
MNMIPGVERGARPLALVILADTSSSMSGQPITILNNSLASLIQDLQSDLQTKDSVHITLISFDSMARVVLSLQPVTAVTVPSLSANGSTAMGAAFRLALQELSDTQRIDRRWVQPVVALLSDGQPNDEWQTPLKDLVSHPRVRQAGRVALAVGPQADRAVLAQFASPEYPVLEADQPDKIKTFFKYVTYVTKQMTRTQGVDRGQDNLPADLLP